MGDKRGLRGDLVPGTLDMLVLKALTLDPASLAPSVRHMLHEADPTTVVFGVFTMQEFMARETARWRFTGWLMAIFAR
jgi:hypothetical protein